MAFVNGFMRDALERFFIHESDCICVVSMEVDFVRPVEGENIGGDKLQLQRNDTSQVNLVDVIS